MQFYQYDDRIEILNPGGLYGKARPENFPWVNDGFVEDGTINGTINGTIEFPTLLHKNVYDLLKLHPQMKRIALADNLGVSLRSIARIIAELKSMKLISREGGNKQGEWIVTKKE